MDWRAALDWDVTDDNFLFASFQTGFKSGGFFFSNDSQVFLPEELEAFTLGSRNRLLDDRLQLDVEAFHWRYEDQQVSTITQDSQGVTNLATQNVGNATMNGVEVETEWLVTEATRLSLDAQYLDATYDDFRYVVPGPRAAAVGMRRVPAWHGVSRWTAPASARPTRRSGPRTWLQNTRSRLPAAAGSWPTLACTIKPRC